VLIYGINPVLEALKLGAARVSVVRVSDRAGDRAREVVRAAERAGVPVRRVPTRELDRITRGSHQGVAAELAEVDAVSLETLAGGRRGPALLVVLDGVEDPRNVGAILRTVDAAGADGIVRQVRHAAPLGGAAAKASAGAMAHVPVATVVNIARALEELQQAGVWTVGLSSGASQTYDEVDYTVPTAIVLGAEGAGLRRLVRERCDWLVSIPMQGQVESLNVSAAAAIALFEAVRQRRAAARRAGEGAPGPPPHPKGEKASG
jgi:23S rRNA (guanosine2251-2'-O)-methyltransferase